MNAVIDLSACRTMLFTCNVQAHVLVSRLPQDGVERPEFPFIVLLVSGGHCCLVLAKVRFNKLGYQCCMRSWQN